MRSALTALVAAGLLGTLIFLFVKTEAIEFKNDARAIALLRDMKDLDTRWDADALRVANDFAPAGAAAAADRGAMMMRLLQELERDSPKGALAERLAGLRTAMNDKDAAYKSVRAAHARSVQALERLEGDLQVLAQAAAARSALPRAANRAPGMVAMLAEQLRSDVKRPDVESFMARAPSLEQSVAVLRQEAVSTDPFLGEAAGRASESARAFLAARGAEAAAWTRFSFLTTGARVDLIARSLAREVEEGLDNKDRWRVYLFFYAAALLLALGYLGMRVAEAQRQLRGANEELENRVGERTRDLSQTLKRLQESEAQLVQSEKMSSLGQMVAGVAHEINTPLAYVKNSIASVRDRMPDLHEALVQAERLLATLQSEKPDPAVVAEIFEVLDARLTRLDREHTLQDLDGLTRDGMHGIEQIVDMVKNLRNFSRLDRSKVASFNVNEGVQATLLIAKPNLRKVDVEKRLGDVPSITCSPSQVNQVLLNIVTNAAQAMDKPRGRITVTTRALGVDAVAIEVEDNGRGIAPEVLPKIFDPFFTTKDVGKGTGLGLTIAYKIVAQHGGRIDVRSTLGVGTTITVALPIEPPPDLAALTAEQERAA